MEEFILEKHNSNGYAIYRIPSIAVTKKGTVIVSYEARHGSDWGAIDLYIARSTDGKNWSERVKLISGEGINAIHNAVFTIDGDTLHLVWCRNYRDIYHMQSEDDGVTWTEPEDVTYAANALRSEYNWTVAATGPGHGIVTKNGTILIPMWLAANRLDIHKHKPSVLSTLYSKDHGKSWACGEIIYNSAYFVNPSENELVELSDGRIMRNSRHETETRLRAVMTSDDGISGWSEIKFDKQLRDPVCAAGIVRAKDKILFSNCDAAFSEGRINLTLKESADDGQTWKNVAFVSKYAGYSDVAYREADNSAYIFAESGTKLKDDGTIAPGTFNLSVFRVPLD